MRFFKKPHLFRSVLAAGVFLACTQVFAQSVTITPATEYQTIRGFGGMNAPGWINDLTSAQVDTAYGNGDGKMGLSIMRMRIDPNSANWSIQVPAAARAYALGATLFATPWSPPAYMKSNNSLNNGGKLLPAYYSAYTTHLLNFASYMSGKGAPLYAISLQNEPDWHPDYESADWTGAEFATFLSAQGSKFGSLKVIAAEALGFNKAYTDPILNSATASPHVDIMGGHLYGAVPTDYPLARSIGKEIWMTEHYTESSNSGNAWPLALDVGTELHKSMAANFNAYVWWYVRRSYGLLLEDGSISKRGYIMSQYARFVRPGYKRIAATAAPYSDVAVTAYKSTSNQIVLVAVNTGTSQRSLSVTLPSASASSFTKYSTSATLNVGYGGKTTVTNGAATLWLAPQSVTTFVGSSTTDTSASASSTSTSSSSSTSASSSSSAASTSSTSATASTTPTLRGTGDYPAGFSKCADLGGTCKVSSGPGWVAFGRKGAWVAKNVGAGKSIACTVAAFGSDPNGNPNKCSYKR